MIYNYVKILNNYHNFITILEIIIYYALNKIINFIKFQNGVAYLSNIEPNLYEPGPGSIFFIYLFLF
jgi:hypothetical protein